MQTGGHTGYCKFAPQPPQRCPECGGVRFDFDASAGASFCLTCGCVTEENTIVAEVTFGETSGGAAIVQGSHVAAGATRAKINAPWGRQGNFESMEQAKHKARQILQGLKRHLGITETVIGYAERWWILAYEMGFTKGRRSLLVIGACCYIAVRQHQRPIMLIDLSDLLQANVFDLGNVYLQLVQLLPVKNLDLVDPEFYIERFSKLLEFGEDREKIRDDAVRIVHRFKRDWLYTGRRPSGICGAALLLAARMNNYRRSVLEIVQVVKIADTTLKKRLVEFGKTPSASFSLDEFRHKWLDVEQNPPSFTKGQEKEERAQAKLLKQSSGKENKRKGKKRKRGEEEEDESVADSSVAGTPGPSTPEPSPKRPRLENGQSSVIAPSGVISKRKRGDKTDGADGDGSVVGLSAPPSPATKRPRLEDDLSVVPSVPTLPPPSGMPDMSFKRLIDEMASMGVPPTETAADEPLFLPDEPTQVASSGPLVPTANDAEETDRLIEQLISSEVTLPLTAERSVIEESLAIADQLDEKRLQIMRASAPAWEDGEEEIDLDEAELDDYILTDAEVEAKERVWVELNRQYLEKCAAREAVAQGEEEPAPKKRKHSNKRTGPRDSSNPRGATPAESAMALITGTYRKKGEPQVRSKRINYDALEQLFNRPLKLGVTSPTQSKAGLRSAAEEKRAAAGGEEGAEEEEEEEEMEVVEEDGPIPGYRTLQRFQGGEQYDDGYEEVYDESGWQEEV
ncbi:hypothetical protein DACRYDRAFT_107836 [Dacryopinax primogenitus]|uniref:B-related factor 1 n=1 Tax=Dacryopinax primogenitus (strain DJM 731) TaxID=1858805 RepID=M5FXQ6_DACPD|nr:uncharacterized protein DACRYDRAFT_107836 [Dacryopinax primogenitus]EJU01279.1 hypothetical protein DACRYDRAFT_107836 [Dacryopinax primogenitus]